MHSSWGRAVAFGATWMVFLFLLLELAGFLTFSVIGTKTVSGYGYPTGLRVDHPRLGWLYQPNFRGHFKGNLAYLDIAVRTNSAGFRDDSFGPKTAGRPRMVVVGDSVVFGPGVAADDRFMERLQARAHQLAWPLEVRNLAVNGYSFAQYLELARLDFFGLQPDGVLLGFTLNDIEEWNPPAGSGRPHDGPLATVRVLAGRLTDWFTRSYASRFVDEVGVHVMLARMSENETVAYHTKWMRSAVDYWKRDDARRHLGREVGELTDRLVSAGIPFGFLLFPELNDVLHPEEFSYPRETIVRMLEARRIPYCDPYAAFRARADARNLFLQDDSVHYAPAGHALLADELLTCFRTGRLGAMGAALGAAALRRTD